MEREIDTLKGLLNDKDGVISKQSALIITVREQRDKLALDLNNCQIGFAKAIEKKNKNKTLYQQSQYALNLAREQARHHAKKLTELEKPPLISFKDKLMFLLK